MKLDVQLANEISLDVKNGLSSTQIIDKYQISRSTFYRLKANKFDLDSYRKDNTVSRTIYRKFPEYQKRKSDFYTSPNVIKDQSSFNIDMRKVINLIIKEVKPDDEYTELSSPTFDKYFYLIRTIINKYVQEIQVDAKLQAMRESQRDYSLILENKDKEIARYKTRARKYLTYLVIFSLIQLCIGLAGLTKLI